MFVELHPHRRPGVAGCRDMANQLDVIRRILADLDAAMPPAATEEPDQCPAQSSTPLHLRGTLFDLADLGERFQWAKGLAGETKAVVLANLNSAKALGPLRRVAKPPHLGAIEALARDFPHCQGLTELLRRRVALAHCCPTPAFSLPPLLLAGDPGCGKTALAKRIAALMSVPFVEVDMASVHATFSLVGLDVGYATGRPGKVWETLQNECMSPVILLDELDKARSASGDDEVTSFLYSLLEPLTAKGFCDAAIGLAIDASRITWIATCNDPHVIHPAIRSRFTVIDVSMPTSDQMPAVIESIHRELLLTAEWRAWFKQPPPAEALGALARFSPREARLAMEEMYASAAIAGRRSVLPDDVPKSASRARPTRQIGFIHDHTLKGTAK